MWSEKWQWMWSGRPHGPRTLATVDPRTPRIPYPIECPRNVEMQYIFSSQLRADQMPGSPWEGLLMCTLNLSMRL